MAVTVHIPAALRAEAGNQGRLEVAARGDLTLAQVLDDIGAKWPRLEHRIRDERGELRRYVNIYVGGEECRRLNGMSTPVSDRAEILVVPSVAGG